MICSRDLLEAYLDGELDAARQAAVEVHIAGCPDCSETCDRLRRQKAAVRAAVPYFGAPAGLRESIRSELRRVNPPGARHLVTVPWRALAIAASVLLALSLSWNLVQVRSRPTGAPIAESVLSDHVRSLLGTHLLDVPSSDQHTVKPWFAGKLDFSPDVRDLESQGFPLAGGRIEYLAGRRVAALVYKRRQHVINLFIWPAGAASEPGGGQSLNGYNLIHWTSGTMMYWAVSDVSAAELAAFRDLYR
jgi:anti-sigma factor RsiW